MIASLARGGPEWLTYRARQGRPPHARALNLVRQSLHLHADLRFQAFFARWTRKEAFLKATGEGLSFPLSDFTVDPEGDPDIKEIRGDRSAAKSWFLADLILADGYHATLAVEGYPAMVGPYCWN